MSARIPGRRGRAAPGGKASARTCNWKATPWKSWATAKARFPAGGQAGIDLVILDVIAASARRVLRVQGHSRRGWPPAHSVLTAKTSDDDRVYGLENGRR